MPYGIRAALWVYLSYSVLLPLWLIDALHFICGQIVFAARLPDKEHSSAFHKMQSPLPHF
jgi:hypothetical protein